MINRSAAFLVHPVSCVAGVVAPTGHSWGGSGVPNTVLPGAPPRACKDE